MAKQEQKKEKSAPRFTLKRPHIRGVVVAYFILWIASPELFAAALFLHILADIIKSFKK